MERLTTRRADGRIETKGTSYSEIHMGYVPSARIDDKYDVRLAEYEDTGLTPEELKRTLKKYPVTIDKETQIIVDKHAFDSNMDEIVALRDRFQQAEADDAALLLLVKEAYGLIYGLLPTDCRDWEQIKSCADVQRRIEEEIKNNHPGAVLLKELEGLRRVKEAAEDIVRHEHTNLHRLKQALAALGKEGD